ncbi:hypothetical protein SAMN02910456_02701 [Ruminococcaceae bacterium YRB3002]|nr:hypothetical protein SAMN02910456_02701 [Ruminococcaceae bacterium YRB3002]
MSKKTNPLVVVLIVLACIAGLVAGTAIVLRGFDYFARAMQVNNQGPAPVQVPDADEDDKSEWTVMIYMCGTNLETEHGIASMVLDGMDDVKDSDDVNIIVQTGGTTSWRNRDPYFKNDAVRDIRPKTDKLSRFKIEHNSIKTLESVDLASMGDPDTMSDFIQWTARKFPAKKYIFLFWDHGYVEPYGCMLNDELFYYDEDNNLVNINQTRMGKRYINDNLTLTEMRKGFEDGGVHFDLVLYNTCLSASYEIASATAPYADYMVASQENIPAMIGIPLGYLDYLVNDPAVTAKDVGEKILELYEDALIDTNKRYGGMYEETFSMGTMSLIDLSMIDEMKDAMNEVWEQVYYSTYDLGDYTRVVSAADGCENYGSEGNAPGNLIDLKTFLMKISPVMDETDADERAIALIDSGVKSIMGTGRTESNGMSMFFPNTNYVQGIRNQLIASYELANQSYTERELEDMCLYVIDYSFDGYVDNIDEIDGYYWYASFLHHRFTAFWQGSDDADDLAKANDNHHGGTAPVIHNDPIEYNIDYDQQGRLTLNITSGIDGVVSVETNIVDYRVMDEGQPNECRLYTYLGSQPVYSAAGNDSKFVYDFEFAWINYDNITAPVFIIEHNAKYTLYAMSAEVNGEWMYIIFRQETGKDKYDLLYAIPAGDTQSGLANNVHYKLQDGDKVSPLYYSLFCGATYGVDGVTYVRTLIDTDYDSSTSGFTKGHMFSHLTEDEYVLVNFIIRDSFGNVTYTDPVMVVIDYQDYSIKRVEEGSEYPLDPYTSLYVVTSE